MQHDGGGPVAVHLLVRERVQAELEAFLRGALRLVAASLDRGGLVVDHHRAVGTLVDAVPAPDHAVAAEHEGEALLHELGRRLTFLLLVKAPKRLEARLESLALVLRADEPFSEPRRAKGPLEVRERGSLAVALATQVVTHGFVQRETVGHLWRRQDG